MAAKIVYKWVNQAGALRVNWTLVGGNGEIMCQSNQGFKDKRDASRGVKDVTVALTGGIGWLTSAMSEEGPGPRPKKDLPHGALDLNDTGRV